MSKSTLYNAWKAERKTIAPASKIDVFNAGYKSGAQSKQAEIDVLTKENEALKTENGKAKLKIFDYAWHDSMNQKADSERATRHGLLIVDAIFKASKGDK